MKKLLLVLALVFTSFIIATPAQARVAPNADNLFVGVMASRFNPDHRLYTRPAWVSPGRWKLLMRRVGVANCNLIRAYDVTETPGDSIAETNKGDAFQVAASISYYCSEYKRFIS